MVSECKDDVSQMNIGKTNYADCAAGAKDEKFARSWLDSKTVDAWRHIRMYQALDSLLSSEESNWLTIGDGRYGVDSMYLAHRGARVTASDIDDTLLKEAKELNLISSFSKENAESLSFADSSFDYVLCKESYHHFNRPMIALYEMLRVAVKGVVLIEPNDQYIGYSVIKHIMLSLLNKLLFTVNKAIPRHSFETTGNFIYTVSRRELEKVALSLNLRYIAFRGINDSYIEGVEFEKMSQDSKLFKLIRYKIFLRDLLVKLRIIDSDLLTVVLFKQAPDAKLLDRLKCDGFDITVLPENPYAHF